MIATDTPLQFLISIASFIVAIGVLVAVHEFGHFWVARRLGIRVLRFSIGFGKPLYARVLGKDPVEFVIAAIPLGGYVKLLDEREGNVAERDLPRAFNRQPVWKRIAVLLAGPGCNLIFAIALYWVLFTAGVPALKPIIGEIAPDSIAARAGLRYEDEIVKVGGQPTQTLEAATLAIIEDLTDDGRIDLSVRGVDGSRARAFARCRRPQPRPDSTGSPAAGARLRYLAPPGQTGCRGGHEGERRRAGGIESRR